MDSSFASQSPDTSDVRPSFRKPANDASHRKYRRHSPVSRSASPSSSGSFKRDRSLSPNASQGEVAKAADSSKRGRRTDGERDSVKDHDRSQGRRGVDARGTSERHSYGRSRDYHARSDDYGYNRRHGGSDDWDYQRHSSRAGRDSRSGARSEFSKREIDSDKLSRDDRWNTDKGSREKGVDEGSRKRKEMEKDNSGRDRYRNTDRDLCSERPRGGSRHSNADIDMDQEKSRDKNGTRDLGKERDENRDRGRDRDDVREHGRDIGDTGGRDEARSRDKDVTGDRDGARSRTREKYKSGEKDSDIYKEDKMQRRKKDDVKERDRYKERHARESDRYSKSEAKGSVLHRDKDEKKERCRDRYQEENEGRDRKEQETQHIDEKASRSVGEGKYHGDASDRDGRRHHTISENMGQLQGKNSLTIDDEKSAKSTKPLPEARGLSEPASSATTEAEVAHDLNVAKLAAMKAAELVNKNLGVAGCMSADQKKKLLWGSKKSAPPEESSNRWDMAHFADRDRQEKFNKLMGVKGDLKVEQKVEDKDGGLLGAEKQKELQQDLEKQFTAGLRRRDGRTVGLGL